MAGRIPGVEEVIETGGANVHLSVAEQVADGRRAQQAGMKAGALGQTKVGELGPAGHVISLGCERKDIAVLRRHQDLSLAVTTQIGQSWRTIDRLPDLHRPSRKK